MQTKADVSIIFISSCVLFSLLLLLTLFASAPLAAREPASAKQCASWQRQLDKVNNKLRAGYTAKQGTKLRKRRRELSEKIRRQCK